jgi:signal transduction histidine kinase/ActR/RegA family two-component response regulator
MIESVTHETQKNSLSLTQEPLIHVLHVDDDEDFLICSKRYMEKFGQFQIETALSVKEALEKIEQNPFDAVISDYQISEKTGLDFLKELREGGNGVTYILFTGEGREELAMEALNLGADRYFNKNANPEIVYRELMCSIIKAVNAERAKEKIRSLAKFTSENPNPVLRVTRDGTILYANQAAQKYGCNSNQDKHVGIPALLKKAVVSSLNSGHTEEVETGCRDQTFSFVVAPIPDAGYVNIYGRNVTEANAAWNSLDETMNELVRINEKLGVVGRLTRHDAQNKLSIILNNVYLAKQRLSDDQVALGYLQDVESAVEQMKKIFEFANTYSMIGIEELEYLNTKKSFDEAALLFSGVKNIKFLNEYDGLTVLSDSLLRQLFYNLIHNSLVHGKNVLKIRAYYKERKDDLELVYEDDGIGIPEDEKEIIFKEGYGKGTGYGLYLIRKICEAYGWTIRETGTPGEGTRFIMTIPKTNKNRKLSYYFNKT